MKMKKRKRTEKVFVDYNDYKDRPFGLKWGTAFAIDELNKVITENKEADNKVVLELPQMMREDIDKVLQSAFLKSKSVSVQLNIKDELGHYQDNITGKFDGMADGEFVYINNVAIEWVLIRNIALVEGGV